MSGRGIGPGDHDHLFGTLAFDGPSAGGGREEARGEMAERGAATKFCAATCCAVPGIDVKSFAHADAAEHEKLPQSPQIGAVRNSNAMQPSEETESSHQLSPVAPLVDLQAIDVGQDSPVSMWSSFGRGVVKAGAVGRAMTGGPADGPGDGQRLSSSDPLMPRPTPERRDAKHCEPVGGWGWPAGGSAGPGTPAAGGTPRRSGGGDGSPDSIPSAPTSEFPGFVATPFGVSSPGLTQPLRRAGRHHRSISSPSPLSLGDPFDTTWMLPLPVDTPSRPQMPLQTQCTAAASTAEVLCYQLAPSQEQYCGGSGSAVLMQPPPATLLQHHSEDQAPPAAAASGVGPVSALGSYGGAHSCVSSTSSTVIHSRDSSHTALTMHSRSSSVGGGVLTPPLRNASGSAQVRLDGRGGQSHIAAALAGHGGGAPAGEYAACTPTGHDLGFAQQLLERLAMQDMATDAAARGLSNGHGTGPAAAPRTAPLPAAPARHSLPPLSGAASPPPHDSLLAGHLSPGRESPGPARASPPPCGRAAVGHHARSVSMPSAFFSALVAGDEGCEGDSAHDWPDLTTTPSRHMWVGNLLTKLHRSTLKATFEKYASVEDVVTFPGRQYAFVNFRTVEDAVVAYEEMDEKEVHELTAGRRLVLKFRPSKKAVGKVRDAAAADAAADAAAGPDAAADAAAAAGGKPGGEWEGATTPSTRVWLGNVSAGVTAATLRSVFSEWGPLSDAAVFPGRIGPLGYAFINFEGVEAAAAAYAALNNTTVPLLSGSKQLKMRFKPAKEYEAPPSRTTSNAAALADALADTPADDPAKDPEAAAKAGGGDAPDGAGDGGGAAQGPVSRHLWLGNLTAKPARSAIEAAFGRFGPLESVRVFAGKTYAFVNFCELADAEAALAALDGAVELGLTGGKPLVVRQQLDPDKPRGGGGGGASTSACNSCAPTPRGASTDDAELLTSSGGGGHNRSASNTSCGGGEEHAFPALNLSNRLNPNNTHYVHELAMRYKRMSKAEKEALWANDRAVQEQLRKLSGAAAGPGASLPGGADLSALAAQLALAGQLGSLGSALGGTQLGGGGGTSPALLAALLAAASQQQVQQREALAALAAKLLGLPGSGGLAALGCGNGGGQLGSLGAALNAALLANTVLTAQAQAGGLSGGEALLQQAAASQQAESLLAGAAVAGGGGSLRGADGAAASWHAGHDRRASGEELSGYLASGEELSGYLAAPAGGGGGAGMGYPSVSGGGTGTAYKWTNGGSAVGFGGQHAGAYVAGARLPPLAQPPAIHITASAASGGGSSCGGYTAPFSDPTLLQQLAAAGDSGVEGLTVQRLAALAAGRGLGQAGDGGNQGMLHGEGAFRGL